MSEAKLPGPDVATLQRWLQTVLMHPEGVGHGIAAPEANEILAVRAEECEQVLTRSRALSALDRLAIYRHAYYARLVECLRESFPVLRHALGDEIFAEFAVGYLQSYPSQSYTLCELGRNFHCFFAETRPAAEETGGELSWPEFLIDLASLEQTFNEVFDGPGSEDQEPFNADALTALSPEKFLNSRLVCTPSLRLLPVRFPVHRYWSLVRRKQEAEVPEAEPFYLAIYRRDFVVRHLELSQVGFSLLASLHSRRTLLEAFAEAEQPTGETADCLPDVRSWFRDWTAQGILLNIEVGRASSG